MPATGVDVYPLVAPLRRPVRTAGGAVTEAPLVLVELVTSDGITGRSYLALARSAGLPLGPGEVFVTSTVKDLAVGAGFDFIDCGTRALRGVPGEWRLFRVASGPNAPHTPNHCFPPDT